VGARRRGAAPQRLEIDRPEVEAPRDPALLAKGRSEVHTHMVGLFEIETPDEIDVVAREMRLIVEADGIPFNGFIDGVQRAGDGVNLVDSKAGAGKMKKDKGAAPLEGHRRPLSALGRLKEVTHRVPNHLRHWPDDRRSPMGGCGRRHRTTGGMAFRRSPSSWNGRRGGRWATPEGASTVLPTTKSLVVGLTTSLQESRTPWTWTVAAS